VNKTKYCLSGIIYQKPLEERNFQTISKRGKGERGKGTSSSIG